MAKVPFRDINGVLLLDKAQDVSSNKALQDARFIYRAKKAGHTGTLDPFATGLLPICLGEANKYARWLLDADKTYQFTAILGQQSSTGDTEGDITCIDSSPSVSNEQLRDCERAFCGEITQIPPKYSAIKIDGRRAYDLARAGQDFDIPTRQVTIHALSLSLKGTQLIGTTRVSKGTYIRTLVEDIAMHLGTVAYCQSLRRLQIADLIDTAVEKPRCMTNIETIRTMDSEYQRDQLLLPMDILCRQFPKQTILSAHWAMLIRGRQTAIDSDYEGVVRLYLNHVFHGLGEISAGRLKAFRLVNTGF